MYSSKSLNTPWSGLRHSPEIRLRSSDLHMFTILINLVFSSNVKGYFISYDSTSTFATILSPSKVSYV